MNKKYLVFIIICMFLSSCQNCKKTSLVPEEFIQVLRDNSIYMDVQTSQIDTIRKMHLFNNSYIETSIYYFVDGSCSECISKLLKVMDLKNKYECKSKINVVVENQYHSSVEQYIEDILRDNNYNVIFVDDGKIGRNDLNGCTLVVRKGKILSQTFFVDTKEDL